MKYAVIGTNVLVSAMISHNAVSPTVKLVEAIGQGELVPLYDEEIITEYNDVLSRAKFGLFHLSVARLIRTMMDKGIMMERLSSGETFLDASDAVFYEVALSKEGSYQVTRNKMHFPKAPIVVTPAEMMEILAK